MTLFDDPVSFSRERTGGRTPADYLARDTVTPPDVLLETGWEPTDPVNVPLARYTARSWHEAERERMWGRVWQMACHEQEIPRVGDTVVYDNAGNAAIVVRTDTGIRAYYNSCLHRGNRLVDEEANLRHFRCPFHGWTWSLQGDLETIPQDWDFPHVDRAACRLPEVRCGTWGGYVFVTFDEHAQSLEQYLGVLPRHLARWEDRRLVAIVSKAEPCNWKAALDAFIESYHASITTRRSSECPRTPMRSTTSSTTTCAASSARPRCPVRTSTTT